MGKFRQIIARLSKNKLALAGICGIVLLLFFAVFAPLIANGRPIVAWGRYYGSGVSFPFWRAFFAPDSTEYLVEQIFNYALLALLIVLPLGIWKKPLGLTAALLLLLPFFLTSPKIDKTDYRSLKGHAVFAPIPYGPFEQVAKPYEKPSLKHVLGTDEIGRSVASRMLYGARVSLAVGLFATTIAVAIGTALGLLTGYWKGKFDIIVMRLVEVLMCFPTFLLLLILMSIFSDYKFEQSILIVIGVIGFTGWIGVAFLARGETLNEGAKPYVESCLVNGMSTARILFRHILPNISGTILITFSFGVAGAILAESGLSFLGFGVCSPTPSWGSLLRQAFDNPLLYWHLMLFPGIALLVVVCAFNFTGEGLRKILRPDAR